MLDYAHTSQTSPEHELILRNVALAESIARHYQGGARDGRDLSQVALLGLVKAARRFDPDRGFPFAAFAGPTIAGEVKRYLRDTGWAVRPPRALQELSALVGRTTPDMRQELAREPSQEEVAARLGVEVGDVREAMHGGAGMYASSLDDMIATDSGVLQEQTDAIADVDRGVELRDAVARLPRRDRDIVYMRFSEGRSQREIADVLDMSHMQVSRAIAKLLAVLRADLEVDAPQAISA